MKNNVNLGIHNRFDIEVIRAGKTIQKAVGYNRVLDNLWSYLIGSNNAFGTYIQYGSGEGTPAASDTSLFTREGAASVTEVSIDVDHARSVITRVCNITLGLSEAVGVTLTEIGLAGGSGNGALTTHAMLQDMNGNPITIEKTDTDIINVYATIYCHWNVDGENVIFYPEVAQYNSSGTVKQNYYICQTLTGKQNYFNHVSFGCGMGNCISWSVKVWSKTGNVAQKTITLTPSRYTESEGNISGINYFIMGGKSGSDSNMMGLSIKSGTKAWSKFRVTGEAVGTGDGETKGFKTKMAMPENATVKVNGTAVSSSVVTVKKIPVSNLRVMRIDADLSTDGHLVYASYMPRFMGTTVLYNPDYADVGIVKFHTAAYYSTSDVTIWVSNDLEEWTKVRDWSGSSGNVQAEIPSEYQHYKYFKIYLASGSNDLDEVYGDFPANIVFASAPAVGDVITIDYDTECIPKDADHVFDASITFTFGEYTE